MNDDGNAVIGAIINPRDPSGMNFISNEIVKDSPNALYYAANGYGGQDYDFKELGVDESWKDDEKERYIYRGMPFTKGGIYASGRDIGNWGAGYIAGLSGLPWGAARFCFDLLQSGKENLRGHYGWHVEGQPSQRAQMLGYKTGYTMFKSKLYERYVRIWLNFLQ